MSTEERIKAILQEWHDQDNRCTRWPYYVTIRDCRTRYEENREGDFVYDEESECIVSIEDKIKELAQEGRLTDSDYEVLNIEGPNDVDSLHIDWFTRSDFFEVLRNFGITDERTFEEVEDWYTEGVFFTIKDAEQYLESCRNHHTSKAHTYIDCFTKWGRDSQTEQFLEDLFEYFKIETPSK